VGIKRLVKELAGEGDPRARRRLGRERATQAAQPASKSPPQASSRRERGSGTARVEAARSRPARSEKRIPPGSTAASGVNKVNRKRGATGRASAVFWNSRVKKTTALSFDRVVAPSVNVVRLAEMVAPV
jgi:hypothetical protein